jgi:hypothetical protein
VSKLHFRPKVKFAPETAQIGFPPCPVRHPPRARGNARMGNTCPGRGGHARMEHPTARPRVLACWRRRGSRPRLTWCLSRTRSRLPRFSVRTAARHGRRHAAAVVSPSQCLSGRAMQPYVCARIHGVFPAIPPSLLAADAKACIVVTGHRCGMPHARVVRRPWATSARADSPSGCAETPGSLSPTKPPTSRSPADVPPPSSAAGLRLPWPAFHRPSQSVIRPPSGTVGYGDALGASILR